MYEPGHSPESGEYETGESAMGQQTVCACTNYFRAGSEKGHFPKKLFFYR